MSATSVRALPVALSIGVVALILAGLALAVSAALPPESLLLYWLGLGGLVAFVFYAVKGDLLSAILFWFATLIALHEEFWRRPVPLFFSVTIPRIGLVVLVALFLVMLLLGRTRLRTAWPLSGVLFLLLAYFSISAAVSGFETRSVITVHYKLIGGYLFPFVTFALLLHAIRTERDLRRIGVFFALLSVYLAWIGWCEQFELRAGLWPQFIGDPSVGIHWGRVRGPFVHSAAMGLALVYCYFSNLVLARNISRGRWLLYAVNALMLPTIFWTKTRSVWLSFLICAAIWALYSRRRTARTVFVCTLVAVVLLVAVVNMENFLSPHRAKGGWTDMEPLLLRVGLAQMTWQMLQAHPLFGVGFGHFRDYAPDFAKDPSSPFYAFGSSALEHNNLLGIVAETGLVGLVLYLVVVFLLLRCSVRLFKALPESGRGLLNRDLVVLYWAMAAAYFTDGMFRETSDNPFANCLFFGFSAIPVALYILLLGRTPISAKPGFAPIGPRLGSPPIGPRSGSAPSGVGRWRAADASNAVDRPGGRKPPGSGA